MRWQVTRVFVVYKIFKLLACLAFAALKTSTVIWSAFLLGSGQCGLSKGQGGNF